MSEPDAGAWAARVWGLTDTLAGTLVAIAWGVRAPRLAVAR